MSCLYKRMCLTRRWKCVVLTGEICASSSLINTTYSTVSTGTEQQKIQTKFVENEVNFLLINQQYILSFPTLFHIQCRKESSEITENCSTNYSCETEFDHMHQYKDLQPCKICFLQQSTSALETPIERYISLAHTFSISARHRQLKHVAVKSCSKHFSKLYVKPSVFKTSCELGGFNTSSILTHKLRTQCESIAVQNFTSGLLSGCNTSDILTCMPRTPCDSVAVPNFTSGMLSAFKTSSILAQNLRTPCVSVAVHSFTRGILGSFNTSNLIIRNLKRPCDTVTVRSFTKSVEVKEEQVVSAQDIQKFLAASGMKFEQGHTCFITSCPKVTKLKPKDNKQKLYINMTTGHFLCEHCSRMGGWPELTDNVLLLRKHKRKKDYECFNHVDSVQRLDSEPRQGGELWNRGKSLADLSDDDFNQLVEEFDCEKLTVSTVTKYCVRYDLGSRSLLFPVYNMQCSVIGVKRLLLKVSEDEVIKTTNDVLPRSGPIGLFGWNTISPDTTTVVMTTSMVDAMAVSQETKVHAVALPKGFSVLPQELLPSLEQFKKIILWFGDDIRAWEAAKQFAKKLGNKRCYVIRPSSDDPSPHVALCQGRRLRAILDKARPIGHKSIVSFSQLRQEIFSELAHVEQVAGVKWKRFPPLNRILKGHRRGELTVFTGPTGSGKTTFISDYSLDLCVQGVNTLWGSFEINNVRLGKMMLTQFARINLSKHLNQFDKWANLFEDLPMYFMTFHGQENIRNVVETMSHAVYVHDIAHVVVDNLQFMMGTSDEYVDRFSRQDAIVSAFRKFATKMNCHVTLVIHPRKEKEAEDLTTASIFGSAKASQEADNVLILQDKRLQSIRGNKYLQITKNRFDGELGVMLLKFDKEAKGFSSRDKISKRDERREDKKEESKTQEVTQESKSQDSTGGDWFTNK